MEVLSTSTEAYGRGFKPAQYRAIESLEEHAFVSQAEPRVEVFSRQPRGHWLLSEAVGLETLCNFENLDCGLRSSDLL